MILFLCVFVCGESAFIGTELLGRPPDHSININVIPAQDMELYYEYGTEVGRYTEKTKAINARTGKAVNVVLENLQADRQYFYRLAYRLSAASEFIKRNEHTFHTQRQPGSTFTFTIQADSHLGTRKHCDPNLYRQMLQNACLDKPDFHIDLGDTFRSSKIDGSEGKKASKKNSQSKKSKKKEVLSFDSVKELYLDQRPYLGMLCHSAPLFLVLGNHEMEAGWDMNGTAECRPVWSTLARKMYYPNPVPDGFYTGDSKEEKFVGLRENYYAWEWGDALFVTLDPWWYTAGGESENAEHGPRNLWDFTIGDEQYRWLKKTLEQSKAKYKFVFSHHVIGSCRGGIEMAPYAEWGGKDRKGVSEFAKMRPDWEMPIHQLMLKNKVTIFFQGHDHLFATQTLEGIVYQECPMPAYSGYYGQGGYRSGDILPSAGHIRVKVSKEGVTVDYIRSYLPEEEKEGKKNGMVDYSYTINDRGKMKVNYRSSEVTHETKDERKKDGKENKRGGKKNRQTADDNDNEE